MTNKQEYDHVLVFDYCNKRHVSRERMMEFFTQTRHNYDNLLWFKNRTIDLENKVRRLESEIEMLKNILLEMENECG